MIRIIAIVTITGGLWYAVAHAGVVSPLFIPHPLDVLLSVRSQLILGAFATTARCITGYIIGLIASYCIHCVCVAAGMERAMDSQFAAARAVPVIALMPLFVVWFGFKEYGRLLLVVLSAIAFLIAPIHEAYRVLGREKTIVKDQLALSVWKYYGGIVIPATIGNLLGSLRVAMAITFTISIASEYIGAQVGIGKVLDAARTTFNVPGMFMTIIIASVIGVCLDRTITVTYHAIVHWSGKRAKA